MQSNALRDLIEEVRQKVDGPKIDEIQFDLQFNACAFYYRKHGIWGKQKNFLILGLQLLSTLTPDELRAVLGHEFGHLQGKRSKLLSWFMHVEVMWDRFAMKKSDEDKYLFGGWFVRWYSQYLDHRSLALRRREEFGSDRLGGLVAGKHLAARTLVKIGWLSHRLNHTFWPELLHDAKKVPLPPSNILVDGSDVIK